MTYTDEIALMTHVAQVVMLGSSMGGYAAIRAGLHLKATAIIAFSPQVL